MHRIKRFGAAVATAVAVGGLGLTGTASAGTAHPATTAHSATAVRPSRSQQPRTWCLVRLQRLALGIQLSRLLRLWPWLGLQLGFRLALRQQLDAGNLLVVGLWLEPQQPARLPVRMITPAEQQTWRPPLPSAWLAGRPGAPERRALEVWGARLKISGRYALEALSVSVRNVCSTWSTTDAPRRSRGGREFWLRCYSCKI